MAQTICHLILLHYLGDNSSDYLVYFLQEECPRAFVKGKSFWLPLVSPWWCEKFWANSTIPHNWAKNRYLKCYLRSAFQLWFSWCAATARKDKLNVSLFINGQGNDNLERQHAFISLVGIIRLFCIAWIVNPHKSIWKKTEHRHQVNIKMVYQG